MAHTTPPLHVAVAPIPGYTLVTVTGSIQMGNDQVLAAHLTHALSLGTAAVIIDMAEVDFCDSAGLSVLAGAVRHARAHAQTIVACALDARLQRLLRITALDQVIHVRPDAQTAVHWLEYGAAPSTPQGPARSLPDTPRPQPDPV